MAVLVEFIIRPMVIQAVQLRLQDILVNLKQFLRFNLYLRSTMMSYHKQKQVSLNRLESSRHITRSKSGETEVYRTVVPPSTAAVDLPPL